MRWLIALGVLVGGFALASLISARVRSALGKPKRSEKVRQLAGPAGNMAMSVVLGGAIVAALGIGDPDSLKPLPSNLISFIPRLLIAVLFVIVGSGVASLIGNAVGTSVLKATGRPQPQLARAVRSIVTAMFVLLGVGQIGINTRIVDMLSAGVIFSVALSLALLSGLGGRDMARNVAAGRYLRRIVRVGDRLVPEFGSLSGVSGTIRSVHGATVELESEVDGVAVVRHIPHAMLMDNMFRVERTDPPAT